MSKVARTEANISACLTVSMPEVGFQIEIQVQHVLGIAGLLGDDREHLVLNVVDVGGSGRRFRRRWLGGSRDGRGHRRGQRVCAARSGRRDPERNRMTRARVGKSRSLSSASRGML